MWLHADMLYVSGGTLSVTISSTLLPRGTSLIFSFCSGFRVATNLVTCFGCDLAAAHLLNL